MDDDVDKALEEYEPTDSEPDVQDENARMQNAPTFSDIPRDPVAQASDSENPDDPATVGTFATQQGVYANATDAQIADGAGARVRPGEPNPSSVPSPVGPDPLAAAKEALSKGNATATAAGGVGAAQSEHAQEMAQAAEDRDVQAKMDAQERQDQADAQAKALEATHKETEAAAKKYDEFKFHDHWKEASVGNKILATLFSGIGGAAAARTGGQNEALRAMDDISQREYQKDVQNLNKAETFMKWKKEGETDLQSRFAKEKANLQMQQAARLKQMADVAEAHYVKTHPGATVDDAKSNQIVAGLTQKAAETYSGAVQNIYKIEAAKQAALLKAKKHSGGGGSLKSVTDFTNAVNALKPGEQITPEIMMLGRQAGYKPNQVSTEVDRLRATGGKSGLLEEKKTAAEEKKDNNAIKDPWTGDVIGPSPSPRGLTVARKDQAAGVQLVDLLDKYEQHVKDKGSNLTGLNRDDLAERNRLWAGVAAQKRVWSALPASESGLELEKAQVGGTGKLWDLAPQSVKSIQNMKDEVKTVTKQRANILAGKPANYTPTKTKKPSKSESSIPADVIQRARDRAATGDKKAVNWLKGHGL